MLIKASQVVDTEVHTDSQVSKPGCNMFTSKTSPACHNDIIPGLGVEMENKKHKQAITTLFRDLSEMGVILGSKADERLKVILSYLIHHDLFFR